MRTYTLPERRRACGSHIGEVEAAADILAKKQKKNKKKTQFIMSPVELDWTATSSGHWDDKSSMESLRIFCFIAIFFLSLFFLFQPGLHLSEFLGKKRGVMDRIKDRQEQRETSGTEIMHGGVKNIQRHVENRLP